ncbi:phosphoglycerate kinase [Candidatus Schneideria nysicola]|uniref:phosphoglycerate kinase n=1 Tax=Candidatus Schneideria nysicola TaxID=1081631 RepID=UPI001CAA7D1C|nr:phosphoglycerate kinase [Candidatus Schneideria nysicola]UAJ66078.1 phosphoglycerate kinase [Candidatus Schneideria nysicola]
MIKITDLCLYNKRVLIRTDLNVPLKNGEIVSDFRIITAMTTIEYVLKKGGYVTICSHLGQPIEGEYNPDYSLLPIVKYLNDKFPFSFRLVKNYLKDKIIMKKGEILVWENVRFNKGEKDNDVNLSKKYASLCDIFIMDAFGTAHRTHASTVGLCNFSPISCAGPLLLKEINTLSQALYSPNKPIVGIIGGSKISTKLTVINNLVKKLDYLIIGGGIANTFLVAQGYNIGQSLYESNLVDYAKSLLKYNTIQIPVDVCVATELSEKSKYIVKSVNRIENNEKIVDFGESSIKLMLNLIKKAKTLIWNGPIGIFEFPNFRKGTKEISMAIANSPAFSIAGGGDTLYAIELFNIFNKISYISTGGGAFLTFLSGKTLPTILALENKYLDLKK